MSFSDNKKPFVINLLLHTKYQVKILIGCLDIDIYVLYCLSLATQRYFNTATPISNQFVSTILIYQRFPTLITYIEKINLDDRYIYTQTHTMTQIKTILPSLIRLVIIDSKTIVCGGNIL